GRADHMRPFQEKNTHGRIVGLDRLYVHGDQNAVVIGGFDTTGRLQKIPGRETSDDLTEIFHGVVRSHIALQIEETDVIIPAPLGIYFEKLSARFSSHFIRTEVLLQSTTCIELLALRLLKPFNDWYEETKQNRSSVVSIFLDTMSIWPVAEKLRQLHQNNFSISSNYSIESFKSYDGLKKWSPPSRPAFVIISASTSGGLAEEVRKKIGRAQAEIWTMLSLEELKKDVNVDQERHLKCISSIPRKLKGRPALDGLRDEFHPDIATIPPGTETISIVGERFLNQPAKPKRVRLVYKTLDTPTKNKLAEIAKMSIVKIGRGRFDAQSRWSISFDLDKLINMACKSDSGEDSLLKSWLRNYSSPSPIAIVYPSASGTSAMDVAQAALEFAQRTEDVLRELTPSANVFKLSSDELTKSSKPPQIDLKFCSIIIVAPILGNGFVFKQISALLRHKQPKGPRLYLALAVLPESQKHLTQLKSDIASVSSTDSNYEFKFHFAFPIGRLDTVMQWTKEIDLLQELNELLEKKKMTNKVVSERTLIMEEFKTLEEQSVFLPSAQNLPLPLSTGFLLWTGSNKISGNNYAGAVLLSISTLLQASRISTSKDDETSLQTGLFQHALICPETFTRFNDPVIQAAILRAAYPAELNYSVSIEMSHDMKRLLLKWLQYHNDPAGAAAGEFMLAMATDKLTLRKDDTKEVLDYACQICTGWFKELADLTKKYVIKTT
ncbi:MAG: hypothetical protein K2P84_14755, partial [Undibacterium sp.]|nr:hypothetical protein [Undibacterium sp.]